MSRRFSLEDLYPSRISFIHPDFENTTTTTMLQQRNSVKFINDSHSSFGFSVPIELPPAVFKTMQTPTPLLKYGKSGYLSVFNFM